MHSFYLILSIIATIIITSIFYLIKIDRYKKLGNQLLSSFLAGATVSFFEMIFSKIFFTHIYSAILINGGDHTFFLLISTIQNSIKIIIIYAILVIFLNKNADKKEKYDGIIFAVYINAGYLLLKFIFPGIVYGILGGPYSLVFLILISFASVITLGYFIGMEKKQEKKSFELHFIGLGGSIFIGIFYYGINRFLDNSMTLKIFYIGLLIITSIYLTKSHLDEMGK